MGRLRFWPFVGALLIVSGLLALCLDYAALATDGIVGLGYLVGRAGGTVLIPALVALLAFREERDTAPKLATSIFAVFCAGQVAAKWAALAAAGGTYGSSSSDALMLALSVGGGLLAFIGVCLLAGLFRTRSPAL